MLVACLLLTVLFLVGCGQRPVEKPQKYGRGPLAIRMEKGLKAPEWHSPLERWRVRHRRAIQAGDFSERECGLCHKADQSCNNCHRYAGVKLVKLAED